MDTSLKRRAAQADVCLLLEGTFPYVRGGVSSWVNEMIRAYPQRTFGIIFIGGRKEDYAKPAYALPENVVHFEEHYLYEAAPAGAVCLVKPHTRYRLDGWIKTVGAERFARLELDGYEYTAANVLDRSTSLSVTGDSDWTHVEAVIDSGEQGYLLPHLVIYGAGTAWFDDIRLTEA